MDTMRKKVKTWHMRLNNDFGVDGKSSLKQALGLGDGSMPAISLFAMPTLDFASSKVRA